MESRTADGLYYPVRRGGSCDGDSAANSPALWDPRVRAFVGGHDYFRRARAVDLGCRFVRVVTFGYEPFITVSQGFEYGGFEVREIELNGSNIVRTKAMCSTFLESQASSFR